MALLYNVANIWHLQKYYFENNGANPCSTLKNLNELSNSWSVASYIYDPLPPPQKKEQKKTATTTTSQIVRVTLIENFPTYFVSTFF